MHRVELLLSLILFGYFATEFRQPARAQQKEKPVNNAVPIVTTAARAAGTQQAKSTQQKAASAQQARSTQQKAASAQQAKSTQQKAAGAQLPKPAPADPRWLTIKEASACAKQKNRLILADFFTDSCVWCKAMDKKTLQDPSVKSYLSSNFVCMKVNASDGADGQGLATRHQINNFPAFAIFRANGHLMAKFEGYRDPEQFISAIEEIRKRLKI